MSKNQHVVPQQGKWAVREPGARTNTSVHGTQDEAIKAAREIARKYGSELVIHGRDGRIREKSSYGNDPHPPKG
ncbi:MAG TPA: DUF2188 domain-containing protein [Longimicrobium sp.]|jgi:uncharacterized protein YdaT